jgi:hypothetical protein
MFVFLVSPPGVGKTVAIKPTVDALRKAASCKLAPTDVSKASFLDALKGSAGGFFWPTPADVHDYHYMATIVLELSNFMSDYDKQLAGLLTHLWDCPPDNDELKRSGQGTGLITFPGVSLLCGTATENLGATIHGDLWGSGFMARVVMVFSAEERIPVDMFEAVQRNEELFLECVADLKAIGSLKGPMNWTPEARALINDFRHNAKKGAPTHNKLTHYVTRRWVHLTKLCMVSALSHQRMAITPADFHEAKSWLLAAEADMPEIFKDMISHSDGEVYHELQTTFFSVWNKMGRKAVPNSWLFQFFSTKTAAHNVARMIEVAERADIIRRVAGTSGDDTLWVPGNPNAKPWV